MDDKKKDFQKYYRQNLELAKKKIKGSVNDDNLIIQAISSIRELDKASNILCSRLREWYELYNPEFSRLIPDHERFCGLIVSGDDHKADGSMGADLEGKDMEQVRSLAQDILVLFSRRKQTENYLDGLIHRHCPNLHEVGGSQVSAKLIEHAGSLKRLSEMTSSTLQLLGAEKALFRHMKTGARSPKHGIILQHQLLQQAKASERGKVARTLADKLTLAAKVDYFKGQYIGDKLKKELYDRFG